MMISPKRLRWKNQDGFKSFAKNACDVHDVSEYVALQSLMLIKYHAFILLISQIVTNVLINLIWLFKIRLLCIVLSDV